MHALAGVSSKWSTTKRAALRDLSGHAVNAEGTTRRENAIAGRKRTHGATQMTHRHHILRTSDILADTQFMRELEEAMNQRDNRLGISVSTAAAAAAAAPQPYTLQQSVATAAAAAAAPQPNTLQQGVAFARSRTQLEIAAQHWLRSTCNLLEPDQAVQTWLQLVEIERLSMAAATAATEGATLKRFTSSGEVRPIASAA